VSCRKQELLTLVGSVLFTLFFVLCVLLAFGLCLVPTVASLYLWIVHSYLHRRPENYHGMNVAVLGARFSGVDIAFELSKQANKVSTIYFVRFLSMVNMSNMGIESINSEPQRII
jgi:hypothetical protein